MDFFSCGVWAQYLQILNHWTTREVPGVLNLYSDIFKKHLTLTIPGIVLCAAEDLLFFRDSC